jgi:hypothetical protein
MSPKLSLNSLPPFDDIELNAENFTINDAHYLAKIDRPPAPKSENAQCLIDWFDRDEAKNKLQSYLPNDEMLEQVVASCKENMTKIIARIQDRSLSSKHKLDFDRLEFILQHFVHQFPTFTLTQQTSFLVQLGNIEMNSETINPMSRIETLFYEFFEEELHLELQAEVLQKLQNLREEIFNEIFKEFNDFDNHSFLSPFLKLMPVQPSVVFKDLCGIPPAPILAETEMETEKISLHMSKSIVLALPPIPEMKNFKIGYEQYLPFVSIEEFSEKVQSSIQKEKLDAWAKQHQIDADTMLKDSQVFLYLLINLGIFKPKKPA